MGYQPYAAASPLLVAYDPVRDLPAEHLARLVDFVVEENLEIPPAARLGRNRIDPRLVLKILVYGYAIGMRSSRRLEQACKENLAFLFLTRGQDICYKTISDGRRLYAGELAALCTSVLVFAQQQGAPSTGHLFCDSTRIRANASVDTVVNQLELEGIQEQVRKILEEAERIDEEEERRHYQVSQLLPQPWEAGPTRILLRNLRKQLGRTSPERPAHGRKASSATPDAPESQADQKGRTGKANVRKARARPTAPALAGLETPEETKEAEPGAPATPTCDHNATLPSSVPTDAEPVTPGILTQDSTEPLTSSTTSPGSATDATVTATLDSSPDLTTPAVTTPAATAPSPVSLLPPGVRLSARDRQRLEGINQALEVAKQKGWQRVSLTDPQARFMHSGVTRQFALCHAWEIGTDNGFIRVGQAIHEVNDCNRLQPLVESAAPRPGATITAVTADSGYYRGDIIADLEKNQIYTCVPSPYIASDIRCGRPPGTLHKRVWRGLDFTYDPAQNAFICPQNNILRFRRRVLERRQWHLVYTADRGTCQDCPLVAQCYPRGGNRRHHSRSLHINENHALLQEVDERFKQPEHRQRYHRRAPTVETVFAFIRHTLGYDRWLLRGEGVHSEQFLFQLAYGLRKLQSLRQAGKKK